MTICTADDCGRRREYSTGYCGRHQQRFLEGDLARPLRPYGARCSVDDCDRQRRKNGYCSLHWQRVKKHGSPDVVMPRGGPSLGDNVTYMGAHDRTRRKRGEAALHVCLHCDEQARDWAYDHTDPGEKTGNHGRGVGLKYSPDPERYIPLCRGCHIKFDAA